MKTKKILALVSALVLILTAALPAHAIGSEDPALPGQEEAVPPETLPDGEVPGEDVPSVDVPGEDVPSEDVPSEDIPSEDVPGVDVPSEDVPSEDVPSEDIPSEDVPSEDVPSEDVPSEDVPSEDIPGEEVPDEETPDEEIPNEDEIPEEPEPAVINVQVPASGQVVINPYQMAVAVSYGEVTDQIVHEPQVLTSGSDFPVLVSARAVGRLSYESEARFVETPPAPDAADKQIFMYVEFQPADFLWSYSYSDTPNQLLVTDWGMEKENVLTLEAFGAGYFRLFGAMTEYPETMWGAVDAPDVTLAFTFAPLELVPDAEGLPPEENPTEEPVDPPMEDLTETPTEEPVEDPAEGPVEGPIEAPTEDPVESPTDGPLKEPTEDPVGGPTDGPIEEPTEAPVEAPIEAPVEDPVQVPTEESDG